MASSGMKTTSVSWDARGNLLNDYLKKGKTITDEQYALFLDQQSENCLRLNLNCRRKNHSLSGQCISVSAYKGNISDEKIKEIEVHIFGT